MARRGAYAVLLFGSLLISNSPALSQCNSIDAFDPARRGGFDNTGECRVCKSRSFLPVYEQVLAVMAQAWADGELRGWGHCDAISKCALETQDPTWPHARPQWVEDVLAHVPEAIVADRRAHRGLEWCIKCACSVLHGWSKEPCNQAIRARQASVNIPPWVRREIDRNTSRSCIAND